MVISILFQRMIASIDFSSLSLLSLFFFCVFFFFFGLILLFPAFYFCVSATATISDGESRVSIFTILSLEIIVISAYFSTISGVWNFI